jgi:hypothetical protein
MNHLDGWSFQGSSIKENACLMKGEPTTTKGELKLGKKKGSSKRRELKEAIA